MPIPTYQDVMLPLLQAAADQEVRVSEVVTQLSQIFQLSASEQNMLLPSGRQSVLANRVGWARTYMHKAGLLSSSRRGFVQATDEGRHLLATHPLRVDNETLMRYPSFRAFRSRDRDIEDKEALTPPPLLAHPTLTPDEILRATHEEMEAGLAAELLQRIWAGTPAFFEKLIVSLLIAMGYGGTVAQVDQALVGGSGDNGIDGVIDQDPLGLDRIYVQAKRYAEDNPVGAGAIRDFFGSLDRVKASKGLFVTTSHFSASARETAEHLSKRLVLIDGKTLARLMIQHNVGCRVQETFYSKAVDEEFFE